MDIEMRMLYKVVMVVGRPQSLFIFVALDTLENRYIGQEAAAAASVYICMYICVRVPVAIATPIYRRNQ